MYLGEAEIQRVEAEARGPGRQVAAARLLLLALAQVAALAPPAVNVTMSLGEGTVSGVLCVPTEMPWN